MTVFLAILAGTQVLGVSGAILAIPVAATIQVLVAEWLESRKGAGMKPAAPNWRWMRGSAERPPGTPANASSEPPSNWSADAIQRAKGENPPH